MKLPYKFNDEKRKIVFNKHNMPRPWINYLSNGSLHAFVSQAGGGLMWWRTPMIFRITRYRMYNLPIDSPGFYLYIKNSAGTTWSPSFRPCETSLDSWQSEHTPGFTSFKAEKDNIRANLTFFMAPDHDVLIWDLDLENKSDAKQELDLFSYVEFSQHMFMKEVSSGYYNKWMVRVEYNEKLDALTYLNHYEFQPRKEDSPLTFMATNQKLKSYSCSRDEFCGFYRDERDPALVEEGICDNTSLRGGEGCSALHSKIILEPGETKKVYYYLGVVPGAMKNLQKVLEQTANILSKLKTPGYIEKQKQKNKAWWDEHLSVLQCNVPDNDVQRQINTWNPMQSVHTGRYSRSISSSASGERGIGFRDTCQDMLAQAYRKPDWAKKMLFYQATMQFEEGHTVHQSWPEEKKPPQISTRSDNHLWMVMLAYAIISETGDFSILDKKVPFLSRDLKTTSNKVSIWEHLLRGVEFTENHKGRHSLPLILVSDWNDHFGSYGREGRGETLFVAQQYVYILKMLKKLALLNNKKLDVKKLQFLIDKQTEAINKYGWDGEWWLRGYDDEGEPVGTHNDSNGMIWLNTQSWAVMGDVSPKSQLTQGMDSVKKHLDSPIGIRINTPGFPTWPETDNPAVKGLPPGCAENAGIFCHANSWAIIAEAILGRAENAWKYYRQLIPHVALQNIGLKRYTAEPYAYVSTIFGPENVRHGWANVTQVTGTAAWMDIASTQYLLGIRPEPEGLVIDPCLPSDWNGYEAVRKFRGCKLIIKVIKPQGISKGVKSITIDDQAIDIVNNPLISSSILEGKKRINVTVNMGV